RELLERLGQVALPEAVRLHRVQVAVHDAEPVLHAASQVDEMPAMSDEHDRAPRGGASSERGNPLVVQSRPMADAIRRTLVRQALEEGRMPARLPELPVTRGPGSGRPCAICGKPLRASEDELEVRA